MDLATKAVFIAALLLALAVFLRRQRANRPQKVATPKQKRVPPRPAQMKKSVSQTRASIPQWQTRTEVRVEGEPVYREDFEPRLDEIEDYIKRTADTMGLSEQERDDMVTNARSIVDYLPEKPPEVDDICPRCGKAFAMADDYICPECRAQIG